LTVIVSSVSPKSRGSQVADDIDCNHEAEIFLALPQARIAETDSKSTASSLARGDSPDRLWPYPSLTRVAGSRDFDNHCPAIDGHHLIVYAADLFSVLIV
jgi:hypothetical protein